MRGTRIGKKAQVEEHLIHVAIMFYVIYIIVVLTIVLSIFLSVTLDTQETELKVISARLVHEASFYDKDTGRTYAGVIDSNSAKEESINKAINFGREIRLAARATIGDIAIKYNDAWFERLRPRVGFDVKKAETEAYVVADGEAKKARIEAIT
ncbi:hypothetical protein HYV82_00715 [Candidatus Woesearchaeota archaeon]|nr:hypothetical protein [Candidatus Woesearchaeota archaeon]